MTLFRKQISSKRGFSLVELLVVISIIAILATIAIVAATQVKGKQAEKLTRVRIKDASNRVEEYANDNNGLYPVGDDISSSIIYNALSGDFTGQGDDPTGQVYWSELLQNDPNLVGTLSNEKVILDGFGQSLRYRSGRDEQGEIDPAARNDGSFDLWSIGKDGLPAGLNVDSNEETDETQDDIWN